MISLDPKRFLQESEAASSEDKIDTPRLKFYVLTNNKSKLDDQTDDSPSRPAIMKESPNSTTLLAVVVNNPTVPYKVTCEPLSGGRAAAAARVTSALEHVNFEDMDRVAWIEGSSGSLFAVAKEDLKALEVCKIPGQSGPVQRSNCASYKVFAQFEHVLNKRVEGLAYNENLDVFYTLQERQAKRCCR